MSPLLLILVPAVVSAAPVKPVAALLPVRAPTPELTRLGLLMGARASALVADAGRHSVLDVKQVLAMASQEGLAPDQLSDEAIADKALKLLGVDRAVAVSLSAGADGLTVQGTVRDGKQATPFSVKTSTAWAKALTQGSEAIARALLERDGAALAAGARAQPESASDAALKALAPCWETALKQPMGLDAPVGLARADLAGAMDGCKAALKADGSLRFAGATLGLLQAIAREDAEAEKSLGPPADDDAALMPWVLARFWLLTRHQSNEAAVAFLAGVIKKHPTPLVLRSFVASTLAAMNEHQRAVAAWSEYAALAPAAAFPLGRLSRSQARLEKLDAAIATAKKGLALCPECREARLALASRQLDAKKLADAQATLQPLVELKDGPAEPLLRLGWAYWVAGDAKSAAPLFEKAAERAQGPKAWKVKGQAFYNVALVEAKQGRVDAAKQAWAKSVATGWVVKHPDPLLADVVKAAGAAVGGPAPAASGGLYVSLLPIEKDDAVPAAAAELAEKLLREKLAALGATLAPAGEDKKAALSVITEKGLHGYQLRVQLQPGEGGAGLKVIMMVMSYPEAAIKGSWSVKAAKGKQESIVKAAMPRVVDDAAGDLDWKA